MRTALTHKDPTVRAVGARVAGIARARGLSIHLRVALSNETDQLAEAEQVRALVYLGDAAYPIDFPASCTAAVTALARMTVADGRRDIIEGEKQVVILHVSKEHLACVPDIPPPNQTDEPALGSFRIEQPKRFAMFVRNIRTVLCKLECTALLSWKRSSRVLDA